MADSSYSLSHQYLGAEFPSVYRDNLINNSWKEEVFMLEALHELFDSGDYKGSLMVEVGCGPTVHRLASASRYYTDIVTSDYTPANRDSVQEWLEGNPSALDWSPFFRLISRMEGHRNDERGIREIEKRIRKAVRRVVHCDLLSDPPLPSDIKEADLVLTAYCVESITNSEEEFVSALKRLASCIRYGGSLIMLITIGMSSAILGGRRIRVLEVDENFVKDSLSEAGFLQTSWRMLKNQGNKAIGEFKGVSLICGTKTKD